MNFNYSGFCNLLARDYKLVAMRYYVGVVRVKSNNVKGEKMRKNQILLFNNLKKFYN